MGFFGNAFNEENSEILFFILVFLFLFFNTNGFGNFDEDCGNRNDNSILFFIILFLLLFNNFDFGRGIEEPVC